MSVDQIYIRLMPEFSDSPLWGRSLSHGLFGMIAPERLGLSAELSEELVDWNDRYVNTVSTSDYTWPTAELAQLHLADGRVLAGKLQDELGEDYVVLFVDDPDPSLPSREDFIKLLKSRHPDAPTFGRFRGANSGDFTLSPETDT